MNTILRKSSATPIAIVGISGRFPGDATTPQNLWELLKNARSARGEAPPDRFNPAGFYHPDGSRAGSMNTNSHGGYFLKDKVDSFDAKFFSITPEEARAMDPTQRILLELAYESIENAGLKLDELTGKRMSCFVGACQHDYWDIQAYGMDSSPKYTGTGVGPALLANRISWFFDLKGPSVTIDTACSSSMTALHLACESIRSGDSDSALVGSLGLMLLPNFGVFITSMSFLSPDDKCHSFDARANGYARGEGGGFIVLKRLDDAIKNGDTIRAVIRATGANQDGRTLGITQPSAQRQEELIRSTYASAGLDFDTTNYFEAHGTGTKAGDPAECSVIGSVFGPTRQRPMLVGAVKSNIGHLEGASAIPSIIKVIYSLETGLIPPTIGVETVNPRIRLDDWKIEIPTTTTNWPHGIRRASINSFGYGGANAHCVLDDAYHFLEQHGLDGHHNTKVCGCCLEGTRALTSCGAIDGIDDNQSTDQRDLNGDIFKPGDTTRLFILSSHEESGVSRLSQSLRTYLDEVTGKVDAEKDFLQRLAYTLSEKRSNLPWKTCCVASNIVDLQQALENSSSRTRRPLREPQLTFIFTGQGAQWPNMGRNLLRYTVFRQSLNESASYLKSLGCPWDLLEELGRNAKTSKIDLPGISQPACTAVQIGILDLLESWNIRPKIVIGHSSGEIAAAYAKHALNSAAAMRIAYFRGLLTSRASQKGSMAAVGLGVEAAEKYISQVSRGRIVVACINSPSNVTVSGDVDGIDELLEFLQAEDIFARRLRVSTAYHSHHMNLISQDYLLSMAGNFKTDRGYQDVIMFSSVTADVIEGDELGPSYWVTNLVSPVNFAGAVDMALRSMSGKNVFGNRGSEQVMLEIGPHSALQGPLKQILANQPDHSPKPRYLTILKRGQDATQTCLEAIGEVFLLGQPLHISLPNAYDSTKGGISALIDLPHYAWNRSNSYWHESAAVAAYRRRSYPRLELIGARDERSTELEPCWRNYLRIAEQPWIEHHQFQGTNIYPMAGMIVMAIEAIRQIEKRNDVSGYQIRDVHVLSALVVPHDQSIETRLQLSPWRSGSRSSRTTSHWTEFKISNRNESGTWTPNCTGLIATYLRHIPSNVFRSEEAANNSRLSTTYEKLLQTDMPKLDSTTFYTDMENSGFLLGPSFRGVKELNVLDSESRFTMEVLNTDDWTPHQLQSSPLIHPAILDVFVHLLISSTGTGDKVQARVPVFCESLYVSADFDSASRTEYVGYCSSKKQGSTDMTSDVVAFGNNNRDKPMIVLRGCQTVPLRGTSNSGQPSTSETGQSLDHAPYIPTLEPDIEVADGVQLEMLLRGFLTGTKDTFTKSTRHHECLDYTTALGYYVSLLAHKHPALDILEYNPSAKSLMANVLSHLRPKDNVIERIRSCVLVDSPAPSSSINGSLSPDVSEELIQRKNLDLSQDPSAQGFDDECYDIIILDANVQDMLSTKLTISNSWGELLIFASHNHRSRFAVARRASGIRCQIETVLLVMPHAPSQGLSNLVDKLEGDLKARGYDVAKASFDAMPENYSSHLCLAALEADEPFLERLDDKSFSKLRSLFLKSSGTLWLTLGNGLDARGESRGLANGLGRTIRAENPGMVFVTVALDAAVPLQTNSNVDAICRLADRVAVMKHSDNATDSEYVIRDGVVLIERLVPHPTLKTLLDSTRFGHHLPAVNSRLGQATDECLQLSIRNVGMLDTLEFNYCTALNPSLPDDQIEVQVHAVGLNSLDVMVAMGQAEDSGLGIECAGVVSRVGKKVRKFKVGDRVFGMHAGCFQTCVQVDPRTFQETPPDLSHEQAASIMCAYATACHSLINVARLSSRESVLIHSAAEGVGLAAIQVARSLDAEIFVTVSSEKENNFLMSEHGIEESHIFDIRDHSFADGVLRMTDQAGVDVVLNLSSTGEALRSSWLSLAPFGRFIELGKTDILGNTGLEMRPFLRNIMFAGVDILTQVTSYPERFERIGDLVMKLIRKGAVAPLKNISLYSFGEAEKAFRTMYDGDHIGKIVLSPKPDDLIPIVPRGLRTLQVARDATYILVGGFGGIGRSVAKMLSQMGARFLVFLSRSGSSRPESRSLLESLAMDGVSAITITCDVSEKLQLSTAIDDVKQRFPPIKGVIHCAMDLRDAIYDNMSVKDWNLSLRPKVQATRNLHQLLPKDLDFFICLSSVAGVIGSRGQANYNAGNTYQDALMQYRAASGLAATSINLSLVVGVGVSTERDEVFQLLKGGGLMEMDETDVLNIVKAAISGRAPTQVVLGLSNGGRLQQIEAADPYWFKDSRFAVIRELDRQSVTTGDANARRDWKMIFAAATSEEEVYDILLAQLLEGISGITKMSSEDMDPRKSLPFYGIDSLMGIEIRTWLMQEFQADLSVFDIVSNEPLSGFVRKVMAQSTLVPPIASQ
ncbi:hypothetical protein F4677DRAFT_455044 [Hypoxylon crocopeplum]|nr:hypothetical protein F4677DRAFT_455044 [Hypoxylon crocopeplum]